jgi:hypothetical protein
MPQRSPDSGVQPFELRTGLTIGRLRGMNRLADPASTPPNQYHLLTNVRLTANGMRDRAGLATVHDSGNAECITALIELPDAIGSLIELAVDYTGMAPPDPRRIGVFDEEAADPYQLVFDEAAYAGSIELYPGTVAPPPSRGPWQTAILFRGKWLGFGKWVDAAAVEQEVLLQINVPSQPGEAINLSVHAIIAPSAASQLIVSAVVRTERLGGELVDVLYMGTSDGRILRYDGTTVNTEMTAIVGASDFVVRLCVVGGHGLFATSTPPAGNASTDAHASFQATPGGAWTSVTVPSGLDPSGLIAYRQGAYAFSGQKVYYFDPGAVDFTEVFTFSASAAILPFVHAGTLWVVTKDGGDYALTKRIADDDWTEAVWALDGRPYWVLVLSGRVIFGEGVVVESGLGSVEGIVYMQPQEAPVPYDGSDGPCTVTVGAFFTLVDEAGHYRIDDVPAGPYNIVAESNTRTYGYSHGAQEHIVSDEVLVFDIYQDYL